MVTAGRPVGRVTRGTTNPNRLRRVDRWLVGTHHGLLRTAADPLVVDLGYGRAPVTVFELADRLRQARAEVEVVGVEIDHERVVAARAVAGADDRATGTVRFEHGGFDLACLAGRRPIVIRAFNVLRQYEVAEVAAAWRLMCDRLAPRGLVLDGTSDEIGRLACWVVLDAAGPRSLVLAFRLAGLRRPGLVAARLPKVLIERNTHPFAVHAFLDALDQAWDRASAMAPWGTRQRFVTACDTLAAAGWPVRGRRLWRDGLLEVAWHGVSDPDQR